MQSHRRRSITPAPRPARLTVRSSALLRRNPPPRSLRTNPSDQHLHTGRRPQNPPLRPFFRSLLKLLESALNDQLRTFAQINPNALDPEERPLTSSERERLETRLGALRESATLLRNRAEAALLEANDAIDAAAGARTRAADGTDDKKTAEAQLQQALKQKAKAGALLAHATEESEEADSLERKLKRAAIDQVAADAGLVCPGSLTRRRGFQILGPEGWRTFNQDDRLLMAMSSDPSPIIGVLEDLSSRVLNARGQSKALLLPLAQERLRIVEAQHTLEQVPPEAAPEEVIRAVLKAFDQSRGEDGKSE